MDKDWNDVVDSVLPRIPGGGPQMVYLLMFRHMDTEGHVDCDLVDIAKAIPISLGTVERAVSMMEERGFIVTLGGGEWILFDFVHRVTEAAVAI